MIGGNAPLFAAEVAEGSLGSDKGEQILLQMFTCACLTAAAPAEQQRFLKLIESRKYAKPKVFELESGSDFTLQWARENGLRFPVRIKRRSGLGMVLPGESFGVRDVARIIGPTTPIVCCRLLPAGCSPHSLKLAGCN